MAQATRKSVIITFKPKDKRPEKKKDKVEIVSSEISSKVGFLDSGTMTTGAFLAPGVSPEDIGFDINQYEAPIVTASLTSKEIEALKNNPNVEAVEDDGPVYALGAYPDLAANYKGGVSFVPGQTPADGNSHGTHCAGTIAATINGAGVVGVAPAA